MPRIGEALLLRLSRSPDSPQYAGGTDRANIDNSLEFLLKTVPDFASLVQGRRVLDFGCGKGFQSAALARDLGCEVIGLDLERPMLQESWRELQEQLQLSNLVFTTDPPADPVDVVFSCSSFEHFSDPQYILSEMARLTRPDGHVVITFAEPWLSPRGSHMDSFTRLPWVNLLFSEQTVMNVRSRFKNDGATRYEDVQGGLNRMTVARFESLMRSSGLEVCSLRLFPVKGLPVVKHVPVLRELLTAAASCVLKKSASPVDVDVALPA